METLNRGNLGRDEMVRFYDETIEVKADGVPLRPVSFSWKGSRYQITKVDKNWHDSRVGKGGPRRVAWKHRRHRDYFRVITKKGRVFDIYYDRKGKHPEWILYQELD